MSVPADHSSRGWIERDTAVVWHGFTQMSAYADNAPLIIERAEGRELIDVDGRRYLDAISSLWVTTLGHHVPELDAAARAQLDKVAHTTLLGNGNVAPIELAEALAPLVPVDEPHFLFASDGAAAVEQALKIAFQFWSNQGVKGRTRYLALGGAYHGDTIGAISLGAGGFGTDVFDPLRFSALRAPGYDDPDWAEAAVALRRGPRRRAGRGRARTARAGRGGHGGHRSGLGAPRGRGGPGPRRAGHRGRGGHRLRPHRHAVRLRAVRHPRRPAVRRQGHLGGLPPAGRHGGLPARCTRPSSAPT